MKRHVNEMMRFYNSNISDDYKINRGLNDSNLRRSERLKNKLKKGF